MIGRQRSLTISNYLDDKVEAIKKVDIDMWSSTMKQDTYRDALLNVTKLWLLSRAYDRVRKPNWAGFFDGLLREYPMNDEGAKQIIQDLTEELEDKIPDVVITSVTAKPDLVNKGWYIGVKSVDTDTNLTTAWSEDQELSVFIGSNATSMETLESSATKQDSIVEH